MQTLNRALLIVFTLVNLVPAVASAQNFDLQGNVGPDLGVDVPRAAGLTDTDVRITVARIIRVAMGLLGTVALVIVLIGGFTWMTAGGNDEKVEEAKKWISAGVIGLVIIFSAFAISTFVIRSLITATTAGDAGPGFIQTVP
jgi:hypothetical protein